MHSDASVTVMQVNVFDPLVMVKIVWYVDVSIIPKGLTANNVNRFTMKDRGDLEQQMRLTSALVMFWKHLIESLKFLLWGNLDAGCGTITDSSRKEQTRLAGT